jgi:lysyl-tRNA synthetase class 2
MDLAEELIRGADAGLREAMPHFGRQRPFDLAASWPRVTMRQALADRIERAGRQGVPGTPWSEALDRETIFDAGRLAEAVSRMLPTVNDEHRERLARCRSYGERVYALFELLVEENLPALYRTAGGDRSAPVFITEHPVELSPLARRNDRLPEWVDRFEIFLEGHEIANAFSEINDPDDQAERFRAQLQDRERGDEEAMDFDHDYIRALMHGMPPAAGLGLGVDRLVMLLCGQPSIRDVLLFPLLKPEAR